MLPAEQDGLPAAGDGELSARIVVVEPDDVARRRLTLLLADAGHRVSVAADTATCIRLCELEHVDLVVTELVDGPGGGLDLCRRLASRPATAVIVCSRNVAEVDRVLALEVGADDYVTQPYQERELLLRILAVLRRRRQPPPRLTSLTTDLGRLELDSDGLTAVLAGRRHTLGPRQFRLLAALAAAQGRVVSRAELLASVWDDAGDADDATVQVHVRRLRQALAPTPDAPSLVLTVRGQGYRLAASGATARPAARARPRPHPTPDER